MDDTSFARELLILIAVATAGAALFERLRLPSVVSFLLMGALIGPGGLGLVADPDRVRRLAELGKHWESVISRRLRCMKVSVEGDSTLPIGV